MASPIEIAELEKYCKEGVGLNIGCGSRQLGNSIGLDIDPKASAAMIIADAADLPIRDDSLDYIVSSHGLEHTMFAPLIVLREWLRCLKPGGILAIVVPDGYQGKVALEYSSRKGTMSRGGHTQLFTVQQLSDLVSFAGATVLRAESLNREPFWKTRVIIVVAVKDDSFSHGVARRSKMLWMTSILQTALPRSYLDRLRKKARW